MRSKWLRGILAACAVWIVLIALERVLEQCGVGYMAGMSAPMLQRDAGFALVLTLGIFWAIGTRPNEGIRDGLLLGCLLFGVTSITSFFFGYATWYRLQWSLAELLRFLAAGAVIATVRRHPLMRTGVAWAVLFIIDVVIALAGPAMLVTWDPRHDLVRAIVAQLTFAAIFMLAWIWRKKANGQHAVAVGITLGLLAWAALHLGSYVASGVASFVSHARAGGTLGNFPPSLILLSAHDVEWTVSDFFRMTVAGMVLGLAARKSVTTN